MSRPSALLELKYSPAGTPGICGRDTRCPIFSGVDNSRVLLLSFKFQRFLVRLCGSNLGNQKFIRVCSREFAAEVLVSQCLRVSVVGVGILIFFFSAKLFAS